MLIISNDGFIITKCHLTQKICLSWADFYLFINASFPIFPKELYIFNLFVAVKPNFMGQRKKDCTTLPECCFVCLFCRCASFCRKMLRDVKWAKGEYFRERFNCILYTFAFFFLEPLFLKRQRLAAKQKPPADPYDIYST